MSILLNNSHIELNITKECLYINVKDLSNNIQQNDINNVILYYKHIHKISNDYNIKFYMIIDFSNSTVSFNSLSYSKIFINLLNYIHPISETTIKGTFIIINNNIAKILVDLILNIYQNSKPIYMINNKQDIINLTE